MRNQKGFTGFEIVFLIVVLAAAGVAAYYVDQQRNQAKPAAVAAKTQTNTSAKARITHPTPEQISARISKIYSEFLIEIPNKAELFILDGFKTKGYVTSGFYEGLRAKQMNTVPLSGGGSSFICGNGLIPKSVTVSNVKVTDTSATADVARVYGDGSGGKALSLTMKKVGEDYSIDSVTCL